MAVAEPFLGLTDARRRPRCSDVGAPFLPKRRQVDGPCDGPNARLSAYRWGKNVWVSFMAFGSEGPTRCVRHAFEGAGWRVVGQPEAGGYGVLVAFLGDRSPSKLLKLPEPKTYSSIAVVAPRAGRAAVEMLTLGFDTVTRSDISVERLPRLAEGIVRETFHAGPDPLPRVPPRPLTPMECRVLSALTTGSVAEVAREIGYSARHAQRIVRGIQQGLGLRDIRQAIAAAGAWGLARKAD